MAEFRKEEVNGVPVYVHNDIEGDEITIELNDRVSDLPNRELKVIVT